ncbi:MAG: hypothetical protein JXR62_04865 [Bacilli bacterium]|nr:hypothetical protein [Bacilli bacterium]
MNKEKILQKAQNEKKDERYIAVLTTGTLIGLGMMLVTVLFLIIWNLVHGELIYDYVLIVISQLIAFSVFQYIKIPEKKIYVIFIAVLTLLFIANLIVYISSFGVM